MWWAIGIGVAIAAVLGMAWAWWTVATSTVLDDLEAADRRQKEEAMRLLYPNDDWEEPEA